MVMIYKVIYILHRVVRGFSIGICFQYLRLIKTIFDDILRM